VRNSFDLQLWLAEGWALESDLTKSLSLLTTVSKVRPNYPWYARNENLQGLRGNAIFESLMSELNVEWKRNTVRFKKGAAANEQ
jgi:hypothetical protein